MGSQLSRIDIFRIEGLRAARARGDEADADEVVEAAAKYTRWLAAKAARIIVGDPLIRDQADPSKITPVDREPDMPAVMMDSDKADYPAAAAEDSKGAPVSDAVVLTTDDDAAAAFVARTDNPDGTTTFVGKAAGVVTLTWTDGTISLVDTLQVTTGPASQIVVGPPVISPQ